MEDGQFLVPKPGYATLRQQDSDFSYNNRLPQQPESHSQSQPHVAEYRGMDGAKRSILFALAVILVPMLGLAALLIGLIQANLVQTSDTSNPLAIDQGSGLDNDAYYVNFNATTLATISSWSSTVAPLLAVAAMSLASFPISKRLKQNSQSNSTDLPTPFQLSMLLESLTGSIASLYSLGKYRFWPHRDQLASMVRSAFGILVAASLVGYAITAVDTWLHLVMDAVNISVASPASNSSIYGRGFWNVGCVNSTTDFDASFGCSVALATTGTFLGGDVNGQNEAYKTLGNLSETNSVRKATIDTGDSNQTVAFLSPANIPDNHDFRASTLAIGTVCQPILSKCNVRTTVGASTSFKCTDEFYGNLAQPSINGNTKDPFSGILYSTTGVLYFENPALTKLINTSFQTHPQNPFYLGIWARVGLSATSSQAASHAFGSTGHGGLTYLLNCTSTAYDLTYSFVNGSVTSASVVKSNGTTSTSLQAPAYYNLASPWMDTLAYAAGAEPDGDSLASSWGNGYSSIVLGMAAAFTSNRTSAADVIRENRLVTRVPKAPLYTLLAFNCLYALVGVGLAVWALRAQPAMTNDVRERLSVAGLVAFAFEGNGARRKVEEKREMFAEGNRGDGQQGGGGRVGVERTMEGGWEFTLRGMGLKGVD